MCYIYIYIYSCCIDVMMIFSANYHCPGMYRCRRSRVCIFPSHVCDGTYDCPKLDDEMFCEKCPDGCQCQGYIYDCPYQDYNVINHTIRSLRVLRMPYTNITHLNTPFLYMPYLFVLSLNDGDMRSISPNMFKELPSLQLLDLRNNLLTRLVSETFIGLNRLKMLRINGNHFSLSMGSFSGLTNLNSLDLSGSNLSNVYPGDFVGLVNLKILVISNSNIHQINDGAFTGLEEITTINITQNPVDQINASVFASIKSLTNIVAPSLTFCCTSRLPESKCFAGYDIFTACGSLIRHTTAKIFMWILAVLSLTQNIWRLLNVLFDMHTKSSERFCIDVTIFYLCLCTIIHSNGFLLAGIADVIFNDSSRTFDISWQHSIHCVLIRTLSAVGYEIGLFHIFGIQIITLVVIVRPDIDKNQFKRLFSMCFITCFFASIFITAISLRLDNMFPDPLANKLSICMVHQVLNRSGFSLTLPNMLFILFNLFCLHFSGLTSFLYIALNRNKRRQNTPYAVLLQVHKMLFPFFCFWITLSLTGKFKFHSH